MRPSDLATRPVAELIPYAANSRTHSDAQISQIAASITEFGFTNPVLIDGEGGIIAGHGRVLAAKALGLASVPVLVLDHLTAAQRRAYVIADNKLALNAGWDEDVLRAEIEALGAEDIDLGLLGFDADELSAILSPPTTSERDPDETPEPPDNPITQPGDVWLMGGHRIICGDSTDAETWSALRIEAGSATFTSPPYGVGGNAKIRDHYVPGANERRSLYATHDDAPDQWPALMRGWTDLALAHCGAVIVNVQMLANNKRHMIQWMADYANHLVDVAVWDKDGGAPQMQANVLTNAFEWIFVLSPHEGASRAVPLANFHGSVSNVVRINPRGQNKFSDTHRAVMPVDLAAWGISLVSKAVAVVDPFGGVGTTLIAAEQAGKLSRLIELDPAYVDVSVRRWEAFTGRTATLEATGQTFAEVAEERAREVR